MKKYTPIAVEGVNGSGKSTLVEGLEQLLTMFNIPVAVIKTPNYDGKCGSEIKALLAEKELTADGETRLSDLIFENLSEADEHAKELIKEGVFVIFDRWLASELCYRKTMKEYDYSGFIESYVVYMKTEAWECWDRLQARGDTRLRCTYEQLEFDCEKYYQSVLKYCNGKPYYEVAITQKPVLTAQRILACGDYPEAMFQKVILDVDETVLEIIPVWIQKIVDRFQWAKDGLARKEFSIDLSDIRMRKSWLLTDYLKCGIDKESDIYSVYNADDFYSNVPLTLFGELAKFLRNITFLTGGAETENPYNNHMTTKPARLSELGFQFNDYVGARNQAEKFPVLCKIIEEFGEEYKTGRGVVFVDDNQELLDQANAKFPELLTLNPKGYNNDA
jgi:thymidylate kinase